MSISEKEVIGSLLAVWRPPAGLSSQEWAEQNRVLDSSISGIPGKYKAVVTPYMIQVMKAADDPETTLLVGRKSSQIAWTETINNVLGAKIAEDPCNIMMAFPSQLNASDYVSEKFKPFVKSTPSLLSKIGDPDKTSWRRYSFAGGFVKFVTGGSAKSIKSTPAPLLIVEEPSEMQEYLETQGDAITLFTERQKTFPDSMRLLIFGGSPKDKGFCPVDTAYEGTCKYYYVVPCHACGGFHELAFENMFYEEFAEGKDDPKYGKIDPKTATYKCPHCKELWTDKQKNINVLKAIDYNDNGWIKERPEKLAEIGFRFNELLSPFQGSSFIELAKKKITAEKHLAMGKDSKMRVFVNNGLGY